TRRRFLGVAAAGVGSTLLSGCGSSSGGGDGADVRFGIIALTDCSPIVIAHEKGFFKKHGVTSTVVKGASWAAIRDMLGTGGINPDTDIKLIVVPPAQMVANMKVDKMDGFCVGEPWNARVIADGIGYTATNTQDIWKDHPEKVCAFTAEYAEKNPKTVKGVLKALHDASVWLDNLDNRPEQANIVSAATYINCPPEIILGRLQGKYLMGDGRKLKDPNY